jgi:hypothetical protein
MRLSKNSSRHCPFNVLSVRNHTSNNNKRKKTTKKEKINPLQFPCRLFLSPPPPCIFCIYPGVLVGGITAPQRPNSWTLFGQSLQSFPPCYSQSPPPPPPPPGKSGLRLICNDNIVYGNLKSENSHGYAHEPQRNCTRSWIRLQETKHTGLIAQQAWVIDVGFFFSLFVNWSALYSSATLSFKGKAQRDIRDIRDIIFISGIRTAIQSCYQNAA